MQRMVRRSILALILLPTPLVGCEAKEVWLDLPSLSSIDGVWFWRLSEETDTYQRACRISLADPEDVNGQESLSYLQECAWGRSDVPLSAELERDANNPDAVRLGLFYKQFEDPGVYKVSSYGAGGESALSATTLHL